MRLRGKTVVITGATGLLGEQHAKAVLNEGGNAVLLDNDEDKLAKLSNNFAKDFDSKFLTFKCDITEEKALLNVLSSVKQIFGAPNGLVNNAAINPSVEKNTNRFNRIEDITKESWDEEFQVGLWGSFLCTRVFGTAMVAEGLQGSIVNISSDHGLIAPNQTLYQVRGLPLETQPVKPVTYSVIKHGLIGLTRYFSTYWAQQGIRVNTLCPGGVLNGQDEEFLNRFNRLIPLGRPANPNEYQGALNFMLSDESSYMTGATIVIDGGRSVW